MAARGEANDRNIKRWTEKRPRPASKPQHRILQDYWFYWGQFAQLLSTFLLRNHVSNLSHLNLNVNISRKYPFTVGNIRINNNNNKESSCNSPAFLQLRSWQVAVVIGEVIIKFKSGPSSMSMSLRTDVVERVDSERRDQLINEEKQVNGAKYDKIKRGYCYQRILFLLSLKQQLSPWWHKLQALTISKGVEFNSIFSYSE